MSMSSWLFLNIKWFLEHLGIIFITTEPTSLSILQASLQYE